MVSLPNECPGYDIKQSDGETPVMLELWGLQSTLSLPLLQGYLWPGAVALDRVLLELFDISTVYKELTYVRFNC